MGKPWERSWKRPETASTGRPWERQWSPSGEGDGGFSAAVDRVLGTKYESFLGQLESGGNPEAKAPTSTASGIYQFTEKTWLDTVGKKPPEWAKGLDRDELLAARFDPDKSGDVERVLREENAQALSDSNVEVNNINLYAAHHFGAGKAVKFAKARDDAPMSTILTPAQLEANAYLRKLTKADVIHNWSKRISGKPWLRNWGGTE